MNMNLLESVGLVTVFCVCAFIILIVFNIIKDTFHELLIAHKVKKRFDKPPTAKCYCRDCKDWEPETGKCWDQCNSRVMSPAWFCCFAVPLTGEEFEERDKLMKQIEESLRIKRKKRGFGKNGKH